MNVRLTNMSRAPLHLRIHSINPIQPGKSVVVTEFEARRAQLQSEARTGRLLLSDADTGKEIDYRHFRPTSFVGVPNLLSGRVHIPVAYIKSDRDKYLGDFYEFEDTIPEKIEVDISEDTENFEDVEVSEDDLVLVED